MTSVLCFLGGCILGVIYVALLWGTVLKLPKVQHKGGWLMVSAFLRLIVVFIGMILLSQKNIERFTWTFAGFLLVRFAVITYEKKKIQEVLKSLHG